MAVSHTHAAYALPRIIPQFTQKHPNVRLTLRQGNPTQIARWLSDGDVDFSIATEPAHPVPDIVLLPIYTLPRVILTPLAHPLLAHTRPTLEMLAQYRLITYGEEFSYYSRIMRTFKKKGLIPDVVLTATDVDVMKRYVKLGLGVAIITSLAYDPEQDAGLGAVDVSHLFEGSCVKLGLRQNAYLSNYAYEFLRIFAPHLDSAAIRNAISGRS
jgi:LysR family cys regulon transcriptional activator